MNILALTTKFMQLNKTAQDAAIATAQKNHYNQILSINKLANELWNLISKAQYTDQIKTYTKNISDASSNFAKTVFSKGTTKDDSTRFHNNLISVCNSLKGLIKENTFKPFDDLLKAANNYNPVDLPIQDPNAPKPQETNPQNIPANTPVSQTTNTSVSPQISGGTPGI